MASFPVNDTDPVPTSLPRLNPGDLRLILAAVLGAGHRARESSTLPHETPKRLALAALADADALIEAAGRAGP